MTRGSLRSDHASWPCPTSTATTRAAPCLQQAVGEPTGRRAGVERAAAARPHREAVERGGELLAATRHEPRAVALRAGATPRGRRDGPGVGADSRRRAPARRRSPRPPGFGCATSPRRTSSASSRRALSHRRRIRGDRVTPNAAIEPCGASSPRSAATNGGGGSGSPRPRAARPPRSRPRARARTASRARRRARRRSTAGRRPSRRWSPRRSLHQRDRRRLGLARDLRASTRRGRDRGDDRPGAGQQAARDRVGGVEVGGDEARAARAPRRRARSRLVEVEVAVEADDDGLGRRLAHRREPARRRAPRSRPGPRTRAPARPARARLARSAAAAIALVSTSSGSAANAEALRASRRRRRPACSSCSRGTPTRSPARAGHRTPVDRRRRSTSSPRQSDAVEIEADDGRVRARRRSRGLVDACARAPAR